jgi:superfamily I DNA and/or RNA helicase
MSILSQYIKFLRDYNKLLERGQKNIFDSLNYIWVDNILKISGDDTCTSIIPDFFLQELTADSLILTIKKPFKPKIVISDHYSGRIAFNEGKNKFESLSDDILQEFMESNEGNGLNEQIEFFKESKKIYSKLFNAYNDIRNDSNQEVVLSVGFIQFSKQNDRSENLSVTKVNQHLFHFPLRIELLANNSLKVFFSEDDKPYVDFSFLNNTPVRKDPLDNIIDKFESETELLGYKYLYEVEFKNLIEHVLQQISVNTTFNNRTTKPLSDHCRLGTFEISFSPAINIKAKKPRFFEKLTESIIEFDKQNQPEASLMNLILRNPDTKYINGVKKENYFVDHLYEKYKHDHTHLNQDDFSVFFPLSYNNEQKEILDKHQNNRLTVVTGPPGTGKSHSIVNILCSLLAQGKRVLVTAQTDKALESLLDKIPNQFEDLIFTKIKLTNKKRFSLEESVKKITSILTSTREVNIDEKMKHLNVLKGKYVQLKNHVNTILANEYKIFDLSETFKGVKNHEIYEILNSKNETEWNWIKDKVNEEMIRNVEEIKHSINVCKAYKIDEAHDVDLKFDIGRLIKDFYDLEFEEYFELKIKINEIKAILTINKSTNDNIILETDIEAIKSILIDFNNEDIAVKDIQILSRLHRKFGFIAEETHDIISNTNQDELIRNRSKYVADIQKYISLIPLGKEKVSLLTKLLKKDYKRVKYLEEITINNDLCNAKSIFQALTQYINQITDIDFKIKEIEKNSFQIQTKESTSLNEKIKLYNKLVELIKVNKSIIDIIDGDNNVKGIVEIFNLNPFDIQSIYANSIKNSNQFKILQESIKRKIVLNKKVESLNQRLTEPSLKVYLTAVNPLSDAEKLSDLDEIIAILKDLHNKVLIKSSYLKAKSFLELNLPNTLPFLNDIPNNFIKKEAFEFSFAFNHLNQNILLDFQKSKDTLKYYYDEMAKTKSEILFDLSKHEFQNKFDHDDIESFINLLKNYEYNLSQANRSIQAGVRFKNLVRKNSIEISQKLPCWIMKFNDVLNSLGHEPEIFDCIIVDEASQLDFNSLLLSYYAKNMIVVGDDKQTSPSGLSGVSQDDLEAIRDKNLTYLEDEKIHIRTDNSLFSLTKMVAGSANLSLKEHFRCVPEIIAFSRDKFYNNSLRPLKQLNSNRLSPKISIFVDDAFLESKKVIKEIEAIKEYIVDLFNNPLYDGKTIGVVSLGSVDHTDKLSEITEDLIEKFDKEKIEKHNLIIADAAKFQGDERDVMLVSMGVALDINKMNRNEESKPHRIINNEQNLTDSLKSINVALSRAKEQMILFHSIKIEDLKSGDFRIEIINFFKEEYVSIPEFILPHNISKPNRTRENVPKPFDSWFEYDIADVLIQNKYNFIKPQYEVKEKELWVNPRTGQNSYVYFKLDLVVFANGRSVAIECDGDPFHSSSDDVAYDVERQEFLERVGWKIYRILYSKYSNNQSEEIEKMVSFIKGNTRHI